MPSGKPFGDVVAKEFAYSDDLGIGEPERAHEKVTGTDDGFFQRYSEENRVLLLAKPIDESWIATTLVVQNRFHLQIGGGLIPFPI